MKNLTKLTFAIFAFTLLFTACSSSDDNNDIDTPQPELTGADAFTLSVDKVNTPPSFKDPGGYSVWFAFAHDGIYYTNASNTGIEQFMLYYNFKNNNFTAKKSHNSIAAAGYESKIVADAPLTIQLYYIANEAYRYHALTNDWYEINYPTSMRENNGEAGIVYHQNKIYFLGGRGGSKKLKYYDTASYQWGTLQQHPHLLLTPDLVVVNNLMYALGGDAQKTLFTNFSLNNNSWETEEPLPFAASNYYDAHTVAAYKNRYILALASNKMYMYDTQDKKWKAEPFTIETDPLGSRNLFSDGTNVYIVGKDSNNEFSLYKLTLNQTN